MPAHPLAERLERNSIPEPNSGCWLWTGTVVHDGYGRLKTGRRSTALAHRVSWLTFKGPIGDGLLVCHKCDVRSCINPDHLFLGTHADNARDRNDKSRHAHGRAIWTARLTEAQVRAIYHDPRSNSAISASYRVSPNSVAGIKAARIWKHITKELANA